ncbi:cytochrome P450 [Streptomyces palmae]|uniref:Cytochrome P450 n=1 Tax=Streptomyces palmae TaxID=1701085 RepID=A0A4Z0H925_9ACTN|nr:cytochrome P450 [Streptomyces palmae]TGB13607.1 cytochrome P450 [Streptomyces palmae]
MTTAEHPTRLTVTASRGGCPFDPPAVRAHQAQAAPIRQVSLWDGSGCLLITGHQEVRQVLSDARFSADTTRPGFPFLSAGRRALSTGGKSFIRMDDPEHSRQRRMLTGDFTVRKVEAMRPWIRRIAEDLLDAMTAGRTSADLVTGFALPLPSLVICRLLGVPYQDHDFFQECSRIALHNDSTPEEVDRAQRELGDYLVELARGKRSAPDDSIISRLAARDGVDLEEVAAMGRLLLVAGHETTANMTALSVLALLRHPGQLARLREEPALIVDAVEELLRYLTIVQNGLSRVATEDVVVAGRTIRAGEGVICALDTANRDADTFPAADVLDVGRGSRRHVAFGFGVHQCLGQQLARVELQIALRTVLDRLPGIRLAVPFEEIGFREDSAIYGVRALPVTW